MGDAITALQTAMERARDDIRAAEKQLELERARVLGALKADVEQAVAGCSSVAELGQVCQCLVDTKGAGPDMPRQLSRVIWDRAMVLVKAELPEPILNALELVEWWTPRGTQQQGVPEFITDLGGRSPVFDFVRKLVPATSPDRHTKSMVGLRLIAGTSNRKRQQAAMDAVLAESAENRLKAKAVAIFLSKGCGTPRMDPIMTTVYKRCDLASPNKRRSDSSGPGAGEAEPKRAATEP